MTESTKVNYDYNANTFMLRTNYMIRDIILSLYVRLSLSVGVCRCVCVCVCVCVILIDVFRKRLQKGKTNNNIFLYLRSELGQKRCNDKAMTR